MKRFYLNYGGPGFNTGYVTGLEIDDAYRECNVFYGKPHRKSSLNFAELPGLEVTIHTDGIHRSLTVSLDDGKANSNSSKAFNKLKEVANQESTEDYQLLGHNCVRATTNTLCGLNDFLTENHKFQFGANISMPWTLDNKIKNYIKNNPETLVEHKEDYFSQFKQAYNESVNRSFNPFVSNHWQKQSITSAEDVIGKAYGHRAGSGERTKSVLIEMGWVKEDEHKMLHPTQDAPEDFKAGLNEYNEDIYKVQWLKQELKNQGASFFQIWKLFRNDPDSEMVLDKLQAMRGSSSQKMVQATLDAYENRGIVEISTLMQEAEDHSEVNHVNRI